MMSWFFWGLIEAWFVAIELNRWWPVYVVVLAGLALLVVLAFAD